MKKVFSISLFILLFTSNLFYGSCNKPTTTNHKFIGGYVIGKETCNTDESQDYWLVDFTVFPTPPPQVGDTLTLNGVTYTNVLKLRGLHDQLKHMGMKINIEYEKISLDKIATTNCTVTNPQTYSLKEIFIINQGEVR